jgi:hypothetical protein
MTNTLRAWAAPLTALIAAAAFATAAVFHAQEGLIKAQQSREEARAKHAEAQRRLNQVDEERRLIEHYAPAYRALLGAGIIGAERRVDWIDALRAAGQSLRGFAIDYRLAAQQPALLRAAPREVQVRESLMTLRLKLLHEGDLLAFLQALEEARAGLFVPRSCDIKRLAEPFTVRFEPKLEADCELAWITLVPAKETAP